MKIEPSVCFLEYILFVEEVPLSVHNRPEVKGANMKEIQNLQEYETFELVKDVGEKCI